MKSIARILLLACLVSGMAAAAPALAQNKPTVKPPGEGPIPKGRSGVIDNVLGALGWVDCTASWQANSWCSPTKK